MHDQPRRLIDHDQGVVLEHDRQRDVLGKHIRGCRRWQIEGYTLTGMHRRRRAHRPRAYGDTPVTQPTLERSA